MSTQTQAFVFANDERAVHYVRPCFRVIEGGSRKSGSQKADWAHARQSGATGHVYSLHTRIGLGAMTVAACLVLALVWTVSDMLVARNVACSFDQTPCETITVCSGDSLWTIADEHPVEGRTTAEVVRFIREYNNLADTCLYPGMELNVPQTVQA